MKNYLIEQTLHGYSNGHHLLASSINRLSDYARKTMDIMSDLSGPEPVKEFNGYITGYSLVNDQLYALSKTWYADEMKRPGCVWTHTLLIKYIYFDDPDFNLADLLAYFRRPSKQLDLESYNQTIISEEKRFSPRNNYSNLADINSIFFTSNNPIVLPGENAEDYLYEIIDIVSHYILLLGKLNFCTGSLSNRKIDKAAFDLQIAPYNVAKKIIREDSSIYKDYLTTNSNFEWSHKISGVLCGSFLKFISAYKSCTLFDRKTIGNLANIFYTLDMDRGKIELLAFASSLYLECEGRISDNILIETIKLIYLDSSFSWFDNDATTIFTSEAYNNYFNSFGMEKLSELANYFVVKSENQFKDLFKTLIKKAVNILGEKVIRTIANTMGPENLVNYSSMDFITCNVLVRANNRLALCRELWLENRDFQLSILSCIDDNSLDENTEKDIINVILNTTKEDLHKKLFSVFGKRSISRVLSEFYNNNKVNKDWVKIGQLDITETMNWLNAYLNNTISISILDLVLSLDSKSNELIVFGVRPWEKLYNSIRYSLDDKTALDFSLFLLPVLILAEEKFDDNVVLFIYKNINQSLAEQQLDCDSWERINDLLPNVPWYQEWDRCKRLRRAFYKKGYASNIHKRYDYQD